MALSDDLRNQLRALSDDEKKSAGEEILNGLPLAAHDDLLKARLAALFTEKSQFDKRIKSVLGSAASATDENLRMAYKEYSDELRHFSTVRSALTTFLLTVALAALSAYFNRSQSHPFLIAAALAFGVMAVAVCIEFSRRTSKAYLRRKRIWTYFATGTPLTGLDAPDYPGKLQVVGAMLSDLTNHFLWVLLVLIVLAFCYRDSLGQFLPVLPQTAQ